MTQPTADFAANDFVYPTSAELREVEQSLIPRLTQDDPIFDLFPIVNVDSHRLIWEQKDNYIGLQQVRGLNGQPARVKRVGLNRYDMEPGTYGEFIELDEKELTIRRRYGTFGQPVSIADLVREAQDQLLVRRVDRARWILWTLLGYGTFSVPAPNGAIIHTDSFPIQTFTASVPWATVATATPLANFRAIQLLGRGQSANFGAGALAFMNRTTFNRLVSNTNTTDIAGRRLGGLQTVLNLNEINAVLAGEGLPTIVIYDDGYLDDNGDFQLYIPDGVVIVVGKRPQGQRVGEYRMTLNVNNPNGQSGAYTRVIDTINIRIPRNVEVHDGHNGGPTIFFAGAVVKMLV